MLRKVDGALRRGGAVSYATQAGGLARHVRAGCAVLYHSVFVQVSNGPSCVPHAIRVRCRHMQVGVSCGALAAARRNSSACVRAYCGARPDVKTAANLRCVVCRLALRAIAAAGFELV
jgi:hypothetical protein